MKYCRMKDVIRTTSSQQQSSNPMNTINVTPRDHLAFCPFAFLSCIVFKCTPQHCTTCLDKIVIEQLSMHSHAINSSAANCCLSLPIDNNRMNTFLCIRVEKGATNSSKKKSLSSDKMKSFSLWMVACAYACMRVYMRSD